MQPHFGSFSTTNSLEVVCAAPYHIDRRRRSHAWAVGLVSRPRCVSTCSPPFPSTQIPRGFFFSFFLYYVIYFYYRQSHCSSGNGLVGLYCTYLLTICFHPTLTHQILYCSSSSVVTVS
jgi:hypothetical protein